MTQPGSNALSPRALVIGVERALVVAEAMTWMGVPYHHGAAIKGVGVDCAHFLIESFARAIDLERPVVGEYSPDWFLHDEGEALDRFTAWVARYCVARRWGAAPQPGDIALFRYGRAVSHGAIVIDEDTVVHAFRELGVTLGSLAPEHDLFPRLAGFWTLRRWSTAGSAV